MNPRQYNKLYINKNRDDKEQNLLLGYKHDKKELVLYKDRETYFHIPSFSEPVALSNSDLVTNGAVGGPFPAASDRIFKNQENYGNYTPYGNPSNPTDGMWFCSWLYYNPIQKQSYWLDRYYNPGYFDYNKAVDQLVLTPSYKISNPVFVDKPSTMIFEKEVLYKYFHVGEQTYQNLVTFLAGLSSEHLALSLTNWTSQSSIDISNNNFPIKYRTNGNINQIYVKGEVSSTRLFSDSVDFNNFYTTEISLDYDAKYNLENEFTWSFWLNSSDWQNNSFSHLIGNYSSQGAGISLSLEDGTATPMIIIPETYYGHLLFLNEKGEGYYDKNLQDSSAQVSPSLFAIDAENNVIVCEFGNTAVMYKLDHTGEILATTKNFLDEETMFAFLSPEEVPMQLICGENNNIYVLTNTRLYTFDEHLRLLKSVAHQFNNTIVAFSYNTTTNEIQLHLVDEVLDVKFIGETKWSIKSVDGNLYKNDVLFQTLQNSGTKLAVSPDEKLWVLHGDTFVSVIDPSLSAENAIEMTFIVGSELSKFLPIIRKRYINFINQFDRDTNTRKYICAIYYTDEKILYLYNLDGTLQNIVYLNEQFNSFIVQKKNQDYNKFLFESNGDFTGYEHKRVFKNSLFYKNETQLVLRVGLQDLTKTPTSYQLFKTSYSIKNWENESWYHISLVLKNKTYFLYINGVQEQVFSASAKYKPLYVIQPSFNIGTSLGNKKGFNNEVQYVSNIFNGKISDIKIYDYAIDPDQLKFFVKATVVSENVYWLYPTSSIQYIEQIERMFKHKLPGFKSSLFNLKLLGTQITDLNTRKIIEEEIRTIVENTKPAYVDLLKIEWID